MKERIIYTIGIIFLLALILPAQTVKDDWQVISEKAGTKLSINLTGLEKYTGEDIYVWAVEEYTNPIVIESVPKKIYKSKIYYLINQNLKRYGIIQLLYYDEKGNVIKHFTYLNESQEKTYKYSYPILPESNIELILARCLEVIKK